MTSYPAAPPPGQPGGSSPYDGSQPTPPGGQGWAGAWQGPPAPRQGGPVGGGAPVCPRHPDRVSYVTCQRCGRPACPECQRPASVGVHCVDCVREAQRSTRPRVTVFGAKTRPGARPVVTITLIALCVLMFALEAFGGLPIYTTFAYSPAAGRVEPYRMLTAAFLHAGMLHLAMNMIALWFTGPFLEQALGRVRFVALYLVSAFGASVAVLWLTPLEEFTRGVVGASGAVFGLFGAVAVVLARLKMRNTQIFGVIGINLVLTFVIPNISWQGHLGGLVTGALIAAVYAYLPKRAQTWGAVAAIGGLVALLALVTVTRYTLL